MGLLGNILVIAVILTNKVQGWAKEWSLGCVIPASWPPLAAGARFTVFRDHSLDYPCTYNIRYCPPRPLYLQNLCTVSSHMCGAICPTSPILCGRHVFWEPLPPLLAVPPQQHQPVPAEPLCRRPPRPRDFLPHLPIGERNEDGRMDLRRGKKIARNF